MTCNVLNTNNSDIRQSRRSEVDIALVRKRQVSGKALGVQLGKTLVVSRLESRKYKDSVLVMTVKVRRLIKINGRWGRPGMFTVLVTTDGRVIIRRR